MWVLAAWLVASAASVRGLACGDAQLRCAFRKGCGAALDNYMLMCADVLARPSATCPEPCQHALIALTSTEEGKELRDCICEDQYCEQTKQHIEVCRPQVVRGGANATASCRLSQLICVADAQCSTALDYYHRNCRAMFMGRKCSNKCLNSIEILRKQETHLRYPLTACHCDGQEEYDCPQMQNNLNRLCFHKHKKHDSSVNGHGEGHKKTHNEVVDALPSSGKLFTVSKLVIWLSMLMWYGGT